MRNSLVSMAMALALTVGAWIQAAEKPNIIFILADDMGYMDLSCNGSDLYRTPNIDRMASQGARFTNAYAASHVCSPTRASILTGQYPARTRVTNIPTTPNPHLKLLEAPCIRAIPANVPTLGELLQKEGYATAWLGKWHLNESAMQRGFSAGKQDWSLNTTPSETDPKGVMQLTNEAIDFMTRNHDKQMIIGVCHYAVHSPVVYNSEVKAKYDKRVTPELKQRNAAYAAMTEALDDSVGVLLKAIEDQRFKRETVVIFFSDNGGAMRFTSNAPFREGKGTLYEGGIRVPLIMYWPGKIRPGTVIDDAVTSVDFLPTILQMAGCNELPKVLDGVSFLTAATENTRLQRDAIYWHFPHYHNNPPGGAIRKENYKLIEHFEEGKVELYDLSKDSIEKEDLAAAMPEKATELLAALREWRKSVDAPMPKPNPDYDPVKAKQFGKKAKEKKNKKSEPDE